MLFLILFLVLVIGISHIMLSLENESNKAMLVLYKKEYERINKLHKLYKSKYDLLQTCLQKE